jgi:hypothetical protein
MKLGSFSITFSKSDLNEEGLYPIGNSVISKVESSTLSQIP